MDLKEYIDTINQKYRAGNATEHSYRGTLEQLMQTLLPKLRIVNEPKRVKCGVPDYIASRKDGMPVFYIEAKDIGDNDLDGRNPHSHKEQFTRYKQALDYIIFTDYLDFHLYEHGEFVDSVRIAEVKGDKIVAINENEDKFLNLIEHVGNNAIQRITSASRLAKLMAGKARLLKNIIEQAVTDDSKRITDNEDAIEELFHIPQEEVFKTGLTEQMETFRRLLLHDITPSSFADIYAQTIVYGLFAARLNDKTPEDFSRQEALNLIPKTSEFLRNMFQQIAGLDPDPRIEWVLDDLVLAFGITDMQKILDGYNEDTKRQDPMMHFYEDFLAAYDSSLRKARGVWYTPQPVVSFIVRAVDEILQKEFHLPEGLADYSKVPHSVSVPQSFDKRTSDGKKHVTKDLYRVQILDPAMGTGTFLSEIIRQVRQKFEGNDGIWNQYASTYLLPRLYGFEVMMAPYTIAHMKLFLQLKENGALTSNEPPRLNLLLTNSLEEANDDTDSLFSYWLSLESKKASVIKRDCPVMVMIGNPPYSISSQNNGKWITDLVADYKKDLNERNIQPLSDDYIKFIRLGQHYIEKNGEGIMAFISNNSFIDGTIHRQMRQALMDCFDKIYILDLHGNTRKKEVASDGSKDENVFDIMQGVSINIFVRTGNKSTQVFHHELYGLREEKYEYLSNHGLNDVPWKELKLEDPLHFFVPKDFAAQRDYDSFFKITELMPISTSGVKTHHDKELVSTSPYNSEYNKPYTYRPLDNQWIDYDLNKVVRHRYKYMSHILDKDNISLIIGPQGQAVGPMLWNVVFVSKYIVDTNIFYRGGGIVFPLYLYKENMGKEERIVNFNKELYDNIAKGLNYLPCYDDNMLIDPTSEYNGVLYPQDLFNYIYAVLHSPMYRERYKEFLKIDFPRIPYPTDWEKFRDLAEQGKELRQLHLMEDLPSKTGITFPVAGSLQVDCYRWQDNRVYINAEQYFEGVPESAWQFFIGGYQPAQKWLKDRKGRVLSFEDVKHYGRIIYVLQQTERIMMEIDTIVTNYNNKS
jgi:type I restriction-modification system DNA methylase subunit